MFYNQPLENDIQGVHFDHGGLLTAEALHAYLPDGAEFYYCGSLGFMSHVESMLTDLGIPRSRRHSEAFAPDPSFS